MCAYMECAPTLFLENLVQDFCFIIILAPDFGNFIVIIYIYIVILVDLINAI